MNAIEFLKDEHNHFRKLLTDIENPSHRYETKRKMFESLSSELIRHEDMEHRLWYPCFKNKLSSEVSHLLTEERIAEREISKLDCMKSPEMWEQRFIQLKKDIEHHAKEEEQKLFPEVIRLLSPTDLECIGKEMSQYKKDHPTKH